MQNKLKEIILKEAVGNPEFCCRLADVTGYICPYTDGQECRGHICAERTIDDLFSIHKRIKPNEKVLVKTKNLGSWEEVYYVGKLNNNTYCYKNDPSSDDVCTTDEKPVRM